MDLIRKNNGITIIEILIASLLASVVFLAAASSYTSGLRLLASTRDSASLDPAMAMNFMSKNIALANQIAVSSSGERLLLRLDYSDDNGDGIFDVPNHTSKTSDDVYIAYWFSGSDGSKIFYASPSLPGDANGNGVVDGGDYTTWADQYGQTGAGLAGDFNHDGTVDGGDYTIWADGYNPSVNIDVTPHEVIPGLKATGSFGSFNLNPMAVTVNIQSGDKTLTTTVAAGAGAS